MYPAITRRHSLPLAWLSVAYSILLLAPRDVWGQGCVIARGGGHAAVTDGSGLLESGQWQVSVALRWFRSDRHFAGDVEQTERKANSTEVVNQSYFSDVILTRAWSRRLGFNLTLPFVHHDRSSLYEHLGNASGRRFHTQASGLGDVRLGASYWIFNPENHRRGNVSVGFGIKAPTGDYEARDTFTRASGPTERYVDTSIQPGDGGWGAEVELQGYHHLAGGLFAYGSAYYLFNPRERIPSTGFSVPDSYLARGGFDVRVAAVRGLAVSLGGRIEGVPGNDAFGGSRGSRRPGFAVAVEPGITYQRGAYSGALTVPVAVHRNRTTTYGSVRAGDAAFADYTINTRFSIRL